MLAPTADTLLDGLDESQRAAVTTDAAPLAILAGAGSGKTRVLTRRIAWQVREERIDATHVLAVTFTRKAAGELVSRLGRLGVRGQLSAGTFHAIALAQLRRRHADRGTEMPALLERKARIIGPLLAGTARVARQSSAERAVRAMEMATEIEWAKARLIGPDRYEVAVASAARTPSRPAAEVAALYAAYEREKKKRRLADFDDLIWWCARAIETDREFAAVQRWRFRHLFVDEFQDASPAQFRLVRAWLGDRTNLCVVGDPDQAIYGFAGADTAHLTRFEQLLPGATTVRLEANYRSTPQIVAAAQAVLADSGRRLPPVRVPQPEGAAPTITAYPTDDAEARGVARALCDAHAAGRSWHALAVLYRTNAQSAAFEEALAREAVPFRVRGAGRFLDRPEVKAALDALRDTARAAPRRPFADHLTDLASDAADLAEERREHVDALARLGREYLAVDGGAGSLDGFLAYLTTSLRGEGTAESGDAVELLTFHRAKGLEFHTVFVAGMERGLVPISFAETPAERAEERRLLYVALSRAARELHLTWAEQRTVGLRSSKRTPSPWVGIVAATLPGRDPGRAPPTVVDPRAALAGVRARLAPSAADPELMAALVEWRRNLARAAGVPAYVIFNNATLGEVAAAKPHSREALLTLPGIGPVKAERYGDALLDLVARHPVPQG